MTDKELKKWADDIRVMQGKLMNKQQMSELGAVRHGDLNIKMQEKFERAAVIK